MKKCAVVLLAVLLLSGCGTTQTMVETVSDEWEIPVAAKPREIALELPGEALACAMESDTGRIYFGDSYEICVQTLSSGDLGATVEELTGFDRERVTMLQTQTGDVDRWEFAWATAGEPGERLGRGVILDDGDYHYCMTVLQDADVTDCQIVWSEVFRTFDLV